MIKKAVVYSITNTKTGTKYIGKTINPETRWARHKGDAKNGVKGRLYTAMRKYGIETFNFEVVNEFENESDAFFYEEKFMQELKQQKARLYNNAPGGLGGYGGTRSSREGLKKFYSNSANRQNVSDKVNASYERKEVRQRVAKKMTEELVLEIREKYGSQEDIDFDAIGLLYNVSGGTIWQIIRFKTWKHAGK